MISSKDIVIKDYRPFRIRKEDAEGIVSVYDTKTDWGLVAKSSPYMVLPTPKEPQSNDWKDQNGLEEYTDKMFYEPIDISVTFWAKFATVAELNAAILALFEVIKEGEFGIYDAYLGFGRQNVRYAGSSEPEFRARENYATATFSVDFRINDPVTIMPLSDVGL